MEMTDFDKYIQTFHDYRKTRIFWMEKNIKNYNKTKWWTQYKKKNQHKTRIRLLEKCINITFSKTTLKE